MQESVEILVIDDDDNHLAIFKEKLNGLSYKNVTLVNSYKKAEEILDFTTPDLILIDYYLDRGKTCVDFVKDNLLNKNIPVIVLSTFYNSKVFDDVLQIGPIDFLSKSCTDFELKKSIDLSMLKNKEFFKKSKLNDFFFIKVGKTVKKIDIDKIEMIEVDGKYLNINLDKRTYIIRSSLNDFIKRLPDNFVKIHQSFIVNLNFVESINLEEGKVKLNTFEAYFSRNFKKALLNSYYLG